jgi:hypothetical protein
MELQRNRRYWYTYTTPLFKVYQLGVPLFLTLISPAAVIPWNEYTTY